MMQDGSQNNPNFVLRRERVTEGNPRQNFQTLDPKRQDENPKP